MSGIVTDYCDSNGFHCWEGETGVKQIHQLCEDIGYPKAQWLYGDPLHQFLMDNPGAYEALLEWIDENMDEEWEKELTRTE